MADAGRTRLGAELRRLREDAKVSGVQVAAALGWSQSKVSRVETGRFGATVGELAQLLDYYGVAEEVRAELLASAARHDGLEGAWVVRAGGPRRRQAEIATVESRVSRLQQYQAVLIPGLLQSPAYMTAAASAGGFPDPGSVAARRLIRQERWQARVGVDYQVILDERVLSRWPGDSQVMIEQLDHLMATSEDGQLDLRVLEAGQSAGALAVSPFIVYHFRQQQPVILCETQTADLYLSALSDVQAYGSLFAGLLQESMSRSDSYDLLRKTRRRLAMSTNRKGSMR